MKCANCGAECPVQVADCEFCGVSLGAGIPRMHQPYAGDTSEPPPIPDAASFAWSAVESDNPYASSNSSLRGPPQLPAYAIPNHLALSIVAAVMSFCCCCIPFGIVPVIFSTQVNSRLASGDYAGAQTASGNAKLWSWVSIAVALSVGVLSSVGNFFVGLASRGV